jgi:hypothetical protein
VRPVYRSKKSLGEGAPAYGGRQSTIMGSQALLEVNLRLATTDYLSKGCDSL